MTRFEWFDKGHAQIALEVGELSPTKFHEFIQYKLFLSLTGQGIPKMQAIEQVAESTKTSVSNTYRAVSKFRK